jgi:GGDEF domain-containing protein
MIKDITEDPTNKENIGILSILFCDIDGLKLANDTYGHLEADMGIKFIANTIKDCIRSNRKPNDSIIYPEYSKEDTKNIPIRFGGDEFIIILPNCTKEGAIIVKNRIKHKIDNNKEKTKNMSLSIGISDTSEVSIPHDIKSMEQIETFINNMLSLAEKRMYEEKNKDINSLSLEEKELFILKHLNRVANVVGLNLNNHNDIDILINILTDLKEKK